MNINHELRIESEIPFQSVEDFHYEWKTNEHAFLEINGYINPDSIYGKDSLYDSKIRIWKEQGNETLFHGYVVKVSEEIVGELKKVHIQAKSASCRLEQQEGKRSFQAVKKTYAEVAREVVEDNEGQIICAEGNEKRIGKPIIQYNETVWAFAKRLASHLETCVVADIISGEPALWFGMRNGNIIPLFTENEYTINVIRTAYGDKNRVETIYETESREFYKIGDKTVFCGQKLIICRVSACFRHGELIFRYLLKNKESYQKIYQKNFIGLGLAGTVVDIRNEKVKVALDLDGGITTGDYYYNWYPETGNALYAMPERGARVEVCFGSWDEKEGFGLNCFLHICENRNFHIFREINIANRNSVKLFDKNIYFSEGKNCILSLGIGYISVGNTKNFQLLSKDNIEIAAKKIIINALQEINFCQS